MKTPVIAVRGFVFCRVPKVATGAVSIAVLEGLGVDWRARPEPREAPELRACALEALPAGERFGFIHSPLARLVSFWADLISTRTGGTGARRRMEACGYVQGMSFAAFLAHLHDRGLRDADPHTQPQSVWLPPGTTLFRLEERSAAWSQLRARFPWLAPLREINRSRHAPAEDYFDAERLAIARELYGQDFELWEGLCVSH